MNTQRELRAFALGCAAGVAIFIGTLLAICWMEGIYFQPIKIERSTGDR